MAWLRVSFVGVRMGLLLSPSPKIVTLALGKVRGCTGNYFSDYRMVCLWFRAFSVYDFDAVLVAISIRLRGKARPGKQLGCKSEDHFQNIANTTKPVLEEAGDVSKSY